MKTSMTGAAILATLATSAVAEGVSSASFAVEVLSKDDGCSLGYLWSEKKEANFPDPQYGDAQYDLMFKKQNGNHQTIHLEDLYNPQGSSAWMNCGYPRPPFESCTGIMLSVNGGEWESGHYLVDAKFRYEMEPELGFSLNNYSKETGIADFEYSGPNHKYSFYGKMPRQSNNKCIH